MEIEFKEYKCKAKKLSFTIKGKEINGIFGNHLENILELIQLRVEQSENIKIDKKGIENIKEKQNKIVLLPSNAPTCIHEGTVKEYLLDFLKSYFIFPKNVEKKLKDSLKIVGLEESILERNYYSLSSSEQRLVELAKVLIRNPEVIILHNYFKFFDMKNRKKVLMILKKLKDQYKKTIVILSENINFLYEETDHIIIYKNDRVLVDEATQTAFQNVEFLKKHDIEIPDLVEFTYLANKNKKAKIEYHRDVRDIIKDIYKHV